MTKNLKALPFKWLKEIAKGAEATRYNSFDASRRSQSSASSSSSDVEFDHDQTSLSDSDMDPGPFIPRPHIHRQRPPAGPTPTYGPREVEETTEALAMQFYKLELTEQRRMMGVLKFHSQESQANHEQATSNLASAVSTGNSDVREDGSTGLLNSERFPFSITAGVEKGSKNRCVLYLIIDM